MISFEDAFKIVEKTVQPLEKSEVVSLLSGNGRTLFEDVNAPFPLPNFNSSAVDGFTIRLSDLKKDEGLTHFEVRVAGTIKAGDKVSNKKIKNGVAYGIMTGAVVPKDFDTVLMKEEVSFDGDKITFAVKPLKGENIRFKGEEFKEGDIVLKRGTLLNPQTIGLLASMGMSRVKVFKKPTVSLITTGSELIETGRKLRDGLRYDANTPMLLSQLKSIGVKKIKKFKVKDQQDEILKVLKQASKDSDITITIGGVSVGEYDFVKEGFKKLGVNEKFWKVAIKPGKPIFFGEKDGNLFFGLPGNPVSAFITYKLFVEPAIFKMEGRREFFPHSTIKAILTKKIKKKKGRTEFLRGLLEYKKESFYITPFDKQESHILSTLSYSNSLIKLNEKDENIEEGQKVDVITLRRFL